MLELGLAVAYHTALGLALAPFVWLAGGGCLRLLRRPPDPGSLLDAYPLGLLAATAASTAALLWAPLGVVAAVALAALVAAGVPLVPRPRLAPAAAALVGCAGFGAGLGTLLHGPTDELDSAAYGGMLFYVDKVVSATQSIVPFHDLLAEGERIIYAEAGTSFVGAVLGWLPGFDPVLYHGATLPTFALASLAIGLALFVARGARPANATAVAAAALLAVAVVPYPTWLTETPPAAFALPLVFPVWRVWRDALEARWLVLLSALVALDLFLTKVVGAIALGLLLVFGLLARGRARPDFRRLLAIGGALVALGAAVLIALLFVAASWYAGLYQPKALPLDAVRELTDGNVEARSLGLALLVLGELALAAALARGRSWALLGAFVPTVLLSWFVAGYGFDIALVLAIFLAALALLAGDRLASPLALAAGALLALAVGIRDTTGVQPSAVLALLALLAFAAIVAPPDRVPAAAAAIGAAAVLALARTGDLDVGDPVPSLTPSDYDIWQVVHDRVPADALVFTTMTGVEVTPHRGWHNYPSIAGRQLYLAGWYDGRLVASPEDRDRRLALNRDVLHGTRAPGAAELSRDYRGYYAVARRAERVPESFRRLYANERFVLYEIP